MLAIGREVYTVDAISVLPKHFRYSKRAKHLVRQLHCAARALDLATCAWGHSKISMGGAQVALWNIYGIWAGGGRSLFPNFQDGGGGRNNFNRLLRGVKSICVSFYN